MPLVTPTPSCTYTRTYTRTSTGTSTPTPTPTPTLTPTVTPTNSSTTTATPFIAAADASYKFVFESSWVNAESAAAAVNVLINNARFGLTRNIGSDNLLNIKTSANTSGVINDFNNRYVRSYFYDGTALNGQTIGRSSADGGIAWVHIPFSQRLSSSNNPNADYKSAISPNIYQALKIIIGTGNALSTTLIYIDKTDNSIDQGAGANYNLWGTDGLTSDYKTSIFNSDINQRYVRNYYSTGLILYNYDYITGLEIPQNDFENIPDDYRLLPDTRYIRALQGDIDITFSYCTELINYITTTNNSSYNYWGARLTLFTAARQ
jgi:hypothetical protein